MPSHSFESYIALQLHTRSWINENTRLFSRTEIIDYQMAKAEHTVQNPSSIQLFKLHFLAGIAVL
jgi:hypothetical protein